LCFIPFVGPVACGTAAVVYGGAAAATALGAMWANPCSHPNYRRSECEALARTVEDICLAPFEAIDRVLNPPGVDVPEREYYPGVNPLDNPAIWTPVPGATPNPNTPTPTQTPPSNQTPIPIPGNTLEPAPGATPSPTPNPGTVTPSPTPGTPSPTPTQQVCDPNRVRQWLQTNAGIPETTPGTAYDYQRHYCGLKYSVSGNGESVEADGIDINTCRLLDAKYIADASESPFVIGSNARQRMERYGVTARIDEQESELFRRYAAVLQAPDTENPFIGLDVITNDLASESYWQLWIDTHGVPNARIREEPWP